MWSKVIEEAFKQKIINFMGEKYGKVNNRQAAHGKSGGTQKRHLIGQSRPNQGRIGESTAGIKPRPQVEIIKGVRGDNGNI